MWEKDKKKRNPSLHPSGHRAKVCSYPGQASLEGGWGPVSCSLSRPLGVSAPPTSSGSKYSFAFFSRGFLENAILPSGCRSHRVPYIAAVCPAAPHIIQFWVPGLGMAGLSQLALGAWGSFTWEPGTLEAGASPAEALGEAEVYGQQKENQASCTPRGTMEKGRLSPGAFLGPPCKSERDFRGHQVQAWTL